MKRNFLSSYRRISCVKGKDIQANIICCVSVMRKHDFLLHVLNLGGTTSLSSLLIWDDRLFYFLSFQNLFSKEGEFIMLYPTLNEVTELLNEYKVTPVFL